MGDMGSIASCTQGPTRGASFEMPPNVDDFFVGPFLYHLIMHYIRRVPNAATQPELYIDFIECFVGDFLVLRHNGAGRAEFIKLAHGLYQGQNPKALTRGLGREWDPATNPNFYQLLAFNACRCLLEEGLPTVLSMHAPEDASIDDVYLAFDGPSKAYALTDKRGASDPSHLLHSFENRVKHLHRRLPAGR